MGELPPTPPPTTLVPPQAKTSFPGVGALNAFLTTSSTRWTNPNIHKAALSIVHTSF